MEFYNRYNISVKEEGKMRKYKLAVKIILAICLILALLMSVLLLSSCEKKELCYLPHPHDSKICHTTLTLDFNPAWDGEITDSYTRAGEMMNMRYILEFWEINEDNLPTTLIDRKEVKGTASVTGTSTVKVTVDLPAFKIAVLCWAEPLVGSATTNACFNTTDLRSVRLLSPYGKIEGKDAFTGSALWDYTNHQEERDGIWLNEKIHLLRPFGYYTLIANDIDEYKEKEGADAPLPSKVKVNYQLYIPSVFDVFRQIPSNPITGATYNSPTSLSEDQKQMQLAEDYIFIGTKDEEENFFNATTQSYASDDKLIKSSGNIGIKLKRNKHTLIYGAFLTTRKTNNPGIDDSFDDTVDVVIPD